MLLNIAFFVLAGCATVEQKRGSDLRERVEKYWSYRIKKEYDKSYAFEYPVFKKKIPIYRYVKMSYNPQVDLKEAEIVKIDQQEDEAVVEVRLKMELKAPGVKRPFPYETVINERWINIDGIWYHVPSKRSPKS